MIDTRLAGAEFVLGNAQHLRRGLDQRDAAGGTGATHRVEVHFRAPAPSGDVDAEDRIVVFRVVWGKDDRHVLPGCFQLLSDKLRHGAGNVLAHVGLGHGHHHLAVVTNRIPSGWLETRRCGGQGLPDVGEHRVAQDQAGGGGADDEAAAA